jgi:DNA-binding GntR family transcriptional regulator
VVHTPTIEEAHEIYELRLMLEPVAVRKAVENISDESVAEAARLSKAMRRTKDVGEWVDLNRDFHEILTEPANSPRLMSIIQGLRNAAGIQIAWSFKARGSQMESANDDHDLIVEAYRRRDADAAVEASEHHLRATLDTVERFEHDRAADGDGAARSAAPFQPAA